MPSYNLVEEKEYTLNSVDADLIIKQLDKLNYDLDAVTEKPFLNSAIFFNCVRGTLERFGVVLPPETNLHMLSSEGTVIYQLGVREHFIYIVYNLNDEGNVDGYAQIVDQEELSDLKSLIDYPEEDTTTTPPQKYLPARRDDDSGDDNEYL